MTSHYKQLSGVERAFIQLALSEKQKPSQIAQSLGCCSSTITRELRRNGWVRPRKIRFAGRPCLAGGYRAVAAQERAHDITHCSKVEKRLRPDTALWKEVMDHLKLGYSPEQIAGTLQAVHPNDPSLQLCHETIYTAIYAMPRGELRKEVIGWLRHGHTKRRPRARGVDRRGAIPAMVSIHERPPKVDERLIPGHWEGDLIKGAYNRSSIGTLVERTTLFTVLAKMPSAKAKKCLSIKSSP